MREFIYVMHLDTTFLSKKLDLANAGAHFCHAFGHHSDANELGQEEGGGIMKVEPWTWPRCRFSSCETSRDFQPLVS